MTQTSSPADTDLPASTDASAHPPVRRPANHSLTEADWLTAMQEFLAGLSDPQVAERWGVTAGAVSRQRYNRKVYRRDRPRPVPPPPPLAAIPEGAAGEVALSSGPVLRAPSSDDPRAFSRALRKHAQALVAAGRVSESGIYFRLAQSFLATVRAEARCEASFDAAPGGGAADPVERPALRPAQCAPAFLPDGGDWKTWLFLGGRGAGKTLAGAAWLAGQAKTCARLALVGPTYADVREVMIEGPSGLRGAAAAFGPEGGRPRYEPSRRRLLWSNGAVAQVFTAEEPDGLRGPQFEAAWGDELCAWPDVGAVLAMLRMGLRLGDDPRLTLTTTPRGGAALRGLLAEPGLVLTRGSALDNALHLSPGFVEGLRALYGGTRLERQEIDGEVLEALEGSVFRRADLDRARALGADGCPARFDRVVVAVDPPAGPISGKGGGSACGIVVAGMLSEHRVDGPRAWVLQDRTCHGLSVGGWSARVAEAARWAAALGPTVVAAEANQGGEMVRQVLREAQVEAPIRLLHARLGKRERAEPVSLLYEQGRVAHASGLGALEDQMLLLGADDGRGGASPDRADALVWALTTLVLGPEPRIRLL